GLFSWRCRGLLGGVDHVFDGRADVVLGRGGRAALGRHRALALHGDLEHGVHAGLDVGRPGGLVAELGRVGHARGVTSETGGLVQLFAGRVDGGLLFGGGCRRRGGGSGGRGGGRGGRRGGRSRSRCGGSGFLGLGAFLGGGGG